jgi:glycosyltransferase involved in cell wall biosynthesis
VSDFAYEDVIEAEYFERKMIFLKHLTNCRVSVIIPYYNCADFIEECLESVFRQTHCNFEVIVVDDGSDSFPKSLLCKYPFKYFRICHSGVAAAMNFGFMLSKNQYVLFLEADDKLASNYLFQTLCAMKLDSRDLVFTATQEFGCSNRVLRPKPLRSRFSVYRGVGGQLGAALIKRQVFLNVGGFDERLQGYEDWDFAIRAALQGYNLLGLNLPLHFYRRHSNQLNRGLKTEQFYSELCRKHRMLPIIRLVERILDFIELFVSNPHEGIKRLGSKFGKDLAHELRSRGFYVREEKDKIARVTIRRQ